ncbi:bacterial alpha-L-rhamnosidase-domain-containing protein [Aspergillus desertorum]
MMRITNVHFEHYNGPNALGVEEIRSKNILDHRGLPHQNFKQSAYEIEVSEVTTTSELTVLSSIKQPSASSNLVPWPSSCPSLRSRQKVAVRIRISDQPKGVSDCSHLEVGLLNRSGWHCARIAAPWSLDTSGPDAEQLYRKEFHLPTYDAITKAQLYITAQGVYEAEINGARVGDHFMAPGWTAYDGRLRYQTYDVGRMLVSGENCIGVRVAEGWFCGRISFEGGHRNIWGKQTALLAQMEVTLDTGEVRMVLSDGSWKVAKGPIRLAEIYDGEKYDARKEYRGWSSAGLEGSQWESVVVMPDLPDSVKLAAGFGEPVRRIEARKAGSNIMTLSGKIVLGFGQNMVLEHGELCTRPLRKCEAFDEYILKGTPDEEYAPRFTFHGFRYAQVDGWPGDNLPAGMFTSSHPLVNKLYENIVWGMRGNFVSVPTDCPQRDERLGWSGDLALFAPTAVLLYDCFDFLKNWLIDVEFDQMVLGGVPAMVTPNATLPEPAWCRRVPCAIWHDVTVLAPWALYKETRDQSILVQQYHSMVTWMRKVPKNTIGATHLWDTSVFNLGDWLDPSAPASTPWKGATDAQLVANAFLIHSLSLMCHISQILNQPGDNAFFTTWHGSALTEFRNEYVTPTGRLVSDSQTAYALAIVFNLLTGSQRIHASNRTSCPSWLYPVTMDATTVWERWDSMLPDGTVNKGEMTSFNHYAFKSIAHFLYERVAGLTRVSPGWEEVRVVPGVIAGRGGGGGGGAFAFRSASAEHVTPYGVVKCEWAIEGPGHRNERNRIEVKVSVPLGSLLGLASGYLGRGFAGHDAWPVEPLPSKS